MLTTGDKLATITRLEADLNISLRGYPQQQAYARALFVQARAQVAAEATAPLRFEFKYLPATEPVTFITRGGNWTPRVTPAGLTLWLAAQMPGHDLLALRLPDLRAAQKVLARQVESLARVDLDLANALAPARGDEGGLHVRAHPNNSSLMYVRWRPPPGVRIARQAALPGYDRPGTYPALLSAS